MSKTTTAPLALGAAALIVGGAAATGAVLGAQNNASAVSPTVPDDFAPFLEAVDEAAARHGERS